jgi:hypothetical protein
MYLQPYALQTLVPGEPTPEAFYREEYMTQRQDDDSSHEELVLPADRARARLLRAANAVGVGRFFA